MKRKQVIQTALTGLVMGTLTAALIYTGFIEMENQERVGLGFGLVSLVINVPILLYGFYVMKERSEAVE